jgi:2-hydroxychromene-2-carboxylate isomerase
MAKLIDYYYAMPSPWAFLGAERFMRIADAAGATVVYKPCDFGRVFSRTGGLKLKDRAPARQAYRLIELRRWSRQLDIRLNPEPTFFPVADELAARFVIAAGQLGIPMGPLTLAIMRAVWQDERDIADADTLRALADAQGLAGAALLTKAREPATLEAYERNSDDAVARGVFGAPTYVYRDEPFWGQDRLDFFERALKA